MNYLPFAEDEVAEEELAAALLVLTDPAKRADPALVAAATSAAPGQRAAAAYVLGRRPDSADRVPARALLADPVIRVRFQAAVALAKAGERDAVAELIAQLEIADANTAWRAEDLLLRLAGENAPKVSPAGGSAADRRVWRAAWAAWWADNIDTVDLARLKTDPTAYLGLLLVTEWNTRRVWECGEDGKLLWQLTNLDGPMDAVPLPGGHILLAESEGRRVTERDRGGKVVWEKKLAQEPIGCQRLPGGNTFIATRGSPTGSLMEVTPDGKPVYTVHPAESFNCACRTRAGHLVFVTDGGRLSELDTVGKSVKSLQIGQSGTWAAIEELPNGRFLLTTYQHQANGHVLEIDGDGKILWQHPVPGACGVCRLPNGNTVVGSGRRLVEIDRAGRQVSERAAVGTPRRMYPR